MACGETFGETSHLERPFESYDVICCTAQTLLNWLTAKKVWLENACCLIIDEIHHAVRKHPFVVIMEKYYREVKETADRSSWDSLRLPSVRMPLSHEHGIG